MLFFAVFKRAVRGESYGSRTYIVPVGGLSSKSKMSAIGGLAASAEPSPMLPFGRPKPDLDSSILL